METLVAKRLNDYIKHHKIVVEHLSEKMGINKGSLYNYFNGKTTITLQVLEKFVTLYPQINIAWLLSGKGSMDIEDVENIVNEPSPEYKKIQEEEMRKTLEDLRNYNKLLKINLEDCRHELSLLKLQQNKEKRKTG